MTIPSTSVPAGTRKRGTAIFLALCGLSPFVGCRPLDATVAGVLQTGKATKGARKSLPAPPRQLPSFLYGVTLDSIEHTDDAVDALRNLGKTPITRIVFDETEGPDTYVEAVDAIGKVSYVMGELLDSKFVKEMSLDKLSGRARDFMDRFGQKVDVWEVGNEINGEWLGDSKSVVAKMSAAFDLAKARKLKTALTLYYNPDCFMDKANEMLPWAKANVPARMKTGLDYVFVSYYDDDCSGDRPREEWISVFRQLGDMFPNSKLGFGEMGTEKPGAKAEFIDRYYKMRVPVPRFVGGYFYWYFTQDMVPRTKPLWKNLNAVISAGK